MQAGRVLKGLRHVDRLSQVLTCVRRVRTWQSLTGAYLGLGATRFPLPLETRSGLRVDLQDLDDVRTAWAVFCRDEYTVSPHAHTVLDLGANYGAFTLLAARTAPGARIASCEPFPATFEQLERNVTSNGLRERVRTLPLALAARTETVRMGAAPAETSPHRHIVRGAKPDVPAIEVQALSWRDLMPRVRDALGADRIDLVKIDIEGSEYDVLVGIPAAELAPVVELQMEYHHGPKGALFVAIESAGLRLASDVRYAEDQGIAHFRRSG